MRRAFWYGGPYDGFEERNSAGEQEQRVESLLMDGRSPMVHVYELIARQGDVLIYKYVGPATTRQTKHG